MPRYGLSPEILEGLKPLSEYRPEELAAFLDQLEREVPVSLAIDGALQKFCRDAGLLQDKSERDRLLLCESLTGVHYLRLAPNSNLEGFLRDVESAWQSEKISAGDLEWFTANIRVVWRSRVLRASIKAWTLISDHDKLYLSSRIFTDIRPVFEDDVAEPMLASLVMHSLKITLRVNGKSESIYIAVDNQDLMELKNTVDRAIKKAKVVTTEIVSGGFGPMLEVPLENAND